jgi:hypothetical protein
LLRVDRDHARVAARHDVFGMEGVDRSTNPKKRGDKCPRPGIRELGALKSACRTVERELKLADDPV